MQEDHVLLAGCVITDDYGRLLLLHRYRGHGQWELPGGKVEEDENPADAAIRELREELGVQVQLTKALGNQVFEQEGTSYKYYWFQAQIIMGEPEVMEADTFDDVFYFELEDLQGLSLSANMLILQDKLLSGEVVLQQ
jgi:8-oxo-dGTP diphosphatase